jgi:hypothetical protein
MALPTLITVIGKLLRVDGEPSKGFVYFYSNVSVLSSNDESVMIPSYVRAVASEETGEFTCEVPASNDPAWNPEGWTWRVVVHTPTHKDEFLTVVPYDAVGGEIDFSALVPAGEGGSILYAAYNHTHDISDIDDLQTELDGLQPAGDYLTEADISNLISDETFNEGMEEKLDKVNGVVTDSTFTVKKGDNSSGIRVRATGGAVDFDKTNGDILVTNFAGPGFSGVETGLQRWRADGNTFAGYTEFGDTVYGGAQYVDGANGTAKLNLATGTGLAPLIFMGRKATPGAPTTGSWEVGNAVLDSASVWWYCTVAGTPGTWV